LPDFGLINLATMHNPAVSLTDLALALLCSCLALLAARWTANDKPLRGWWVVFFASIGSAALLGGIVHGFFPKPGATKSALWKGMLLSIGITATTCWILAARVGYSFRIVSWIERFAAAQLVAYAVVVLWVNSEFGVAIVAYLPATMFLLVVLILEHRGSPSPALARGIVGFVLTFVAAAIQALCVPSHPVYFNHDALYHLVQGLALVLIYSGARWTTLRPNASTS
jgi:hypothetical protein